MLCASVFFQCECPLVSSGVFEQYLNVSLPVPRAAVVQGGKMLDLVLEHSNSLTPLASCLSLGKLLDLSEPPQG